VIRGYNADISKKNIECSIFFYGTHGIWSNIFVHFNPNRWFTRMGTDVSGSAKLKIIWPLHLHYHRIIDQPFFILSSLYTIEASIFLRLLAFSKIKFGLLINFFSFFEKCTASSQSQFKIGS